VCRWPRSRSYILSRAPGRAPSIYMITPEEMAGAHECELDEAGFDEALRKAFPPKEPK